MARILHFRCRTCGRDNYEAVEVGYRESLLLAWLCRILRIQPKPETHLLTCAGCGAKNGVTVKPHPNPEA